MRKICAYIFAATLLVSAINFSVARAETPVQQSDLTSMGTRAFNDLTRCINTQHKLDVYYLVDQSNSLPLTDPTNARAAILASSLKALGSFGKNVEVNYSVGFFGSTFDSWRGWARVDPAKLDSEASRFSTEVKSRNKQNETNWLLGVQGATRELAKQQQVTHGCQSLIWLTDGGLWIHKAGAPSNELDQQAWDDASSTLCSSTFDNLRASNVSVFGILLKNDEALNKIAVTNPKYYAQNLQGMQLMRPFVEGQGTLGGASGNYVCGRPVQDSFSAGALLIAKDPVALALQFMILTATTQGGKQVVLPSGNPSNFTIEAGVRKFQLLTTSRNWVLTSPNGEKFSPGSTTIDIQNLNGVQQITVSEGKVLFGTWSFGFEKNVLVTNKLILFSGLDIVLDPGQLIAGSSGTISGQVVIQGTSKAINLDIYGRKDFAVNQVLSSGGNSPIGSAQISNTGKFSVAFQPSASQARLELRVTLNLLTKSGIALAPVSVSKFIDIHLPDNYPTLGMPIKLSDLKGPNGKAKGNLDLHGPQNGSGKICFSTNPSYGISIDRDTKKRVPTYIWSMQGVDTNGCVILLQNQVKQVSIQVSNSKAADASVIAELPTKFSSDKELGKEIHINSTIEFNSTVLRAPAWIVKVFLFVCGIGIPLLLLYLLNRSTSKLIFGTGIQRAEYSVVLDSTRGILAKDKSQLKPTADDFKFIPQQPDVPSYEERFGQLRAKVSALPLTDPWYEVQSLDGFRVLTMNSGPTRLKKRFLSGQISAIKPDMGLFWALQIAEKDIESFQSSSAVPGVLVVYKRNKVSVQTQYMDRVLDVTSTAGIWSRFLEMKMAPISKLEKGNSSEKSRSKFFSKKVMDSKNDVRVGKSNSSAVAPPPPPAIPGSAGSTASTPPPPPF